MHVFYGVKTTSSGFRGTLLQSRGVLAQEGVHFPTTIDYANYLCHAQRWQEVGLLLEQFIHHERKYQNYSNSYNTAESVTLDPVLQLEFSHTNLLHISSLSLAYFYLIKSYFNLGVKLNEVLFKFDQHCTELGCSIDFQLLGYCYVSCENYPKALKAFLKALELDTSNCVAANNVDFCEGKLVNVKSHCQEGCFQQRLYKGLHYVLEVVALLVRNNVI